MPTTYLAAKCHGILLNVQSIAPYIHGTDAPAVLLAIGDGHGFKDDAHLAVYAGIAPTPTYSNNSIHGEHASRSGNKTLKNALCRSA